MMGPIGKPKLSDRAFLSTVSNERGEFVKPNGSQRFC